MAINKYKIYGINSDGSINQSYTPYNPSDSDADIGTGTIVYSRYGQMETIGDQIIVGNIANWDQQGVNEYPVLKIVPDAGYVTAASSFSVNNMDDLVGRVSGVTFEDSIEGGAYQLGNTVLVKVNLDPAFQLMGPDYLWNDVISLDIDGSAIEWTDVLIDLSAFIYISVDVFDFSNIVFTPLNDNAINTLDEANGQIVTELSGDDVTPNVPQVMAMMAVTADSGYYFETQPSLMPVNISNDILRLSPSSVTRDSNNRITAYNFKVIYKNSVTITPSFGAKVFVKANAVKLPTDTTEIKDVIYGAPNILNIGETRPITIYGDAGAEFDITITKDIDGTSIIDRGITNTNVSDATYGTIRGINKKLVSHGRKSGIASYTFNQEFPVNKGYTTTVDGTRDSATMIINGDTGFVTKNNNIRVGDQLIYDDVDTGAIVTVSSITDATTVVLSEAVDMDDNDSIRFVRPESYHINIYPKGSTTLKSNIPTVVPHYTLNQYRNPTLILKTSEADAGYTGPTNVYQYTGRPNAYPSKIKQLAAPRAFSVKWICTGKTFAAVGSTSGIPTWSSTDSTTSHWTNSVYADNGGTHIEIFNIAVTGVGTTTFTLTADVLIKKWGTQDVTMNLDLDQIIT